MVDRETTISLLTIGNTEVGKTSLLLRFGASDNSKYSKLCPRTMPTIGIDFKLKSVEIDNQRFKLQIVSCGALCASIL
jgi:GTPase SAR1 family protein